ncbi:hypothetical protein N2152v2_004569 [Parachlorella kessleri]
MSRRGAVNDAWWRPSEPGIIDPRMGHLAALEKTIWQQYDAGYNSGVVAAQREAVHTVLNMVVQGQEAAAAECCQRLSGVRAAVERAHRDFNTLATNPQQHWGVPQAAELVAELGNSLQGGIRQVVAFMGRPVRDPEDVTQTQQVFHFSQAERAKAVGVLESVAARLEGHFSWECYEKPVGAGKRRAFYLACRKHAWVDQAAVEAARARASALTRVLQPAEASSLNVAPAAAAEGADRAPQQAVEGSLALPPTAQEGIGAAVAQAAKPLRDVGNLRASGQQQQHAQPLPAMPVKRPRQAGVGGKGDPEDVENAGPAAADSGKRTRQVSMALDTPAVLPTPAAPGARPQRRGARLPR